MSSKEKQSEKPTLESSTACEYCNGTGWFMFEQPVADYCRENGIPNIYGSKEFSINVSKRCPYCQGGPIGRAKEVKKTADIPMTFYDKRLSDFDWNIYIKEDGTLTNTSGSQRGVKAFIEQFDKWEEKNMCLYIYSTTKGSGKTFLASCICNELMYARAIKTRFVNASRLIDIALSGDKNSFDEYKRNPMKLLYECKFLAIDDIGQKSLRSEMYEDILYKLLDYRMIHNRMTMFTSNVAQDQLPLDERTVDRISKMSFPMRLPEICVRDKEMRNNRRDLQVELGWIKPKEGE